ncbi:hypothetical protein ADUPG1_008791 [Aduncisulcus paluster]|uniref:Protein kinase domain-containing protein n=1 Tax=Aduncisulcus paluster TaxID=2918883 RepID=A0ABQ5KVJ6_9EUKA|nr:hypothetical protein ADUPG1_008791 [Aduncisulcus paluster]
MGGIVSGCIASTDTIALQPDDIRIMKPEYVCKGSSDCIPIPRDDPIIQDPIFPSISAKDVTKPKETQDQSSHAKKMLRGESNTKSFTHISIPFSRSSPIHGAYICVNSKNCPIHVRFTFTSAEMEKISIQYEFPSTTQLTESWGWFFLRIDIPDVVLCEVEGKGKKEKAFSILSLVFVRQDTPFEALARKCKEETLEKQWSEAAVVKAKFEKIGNQKSRPILSHRNAINPSFSMVKGIDVSKSKRSDEYDQSSWTEKMLKCECDGVYVSHLSIPFTKSHDLRGAYICVDKNCSSPFLLFTFTHADGKKTCKKYEFPIPEHFTEWHFLPIDLPKIVACEIQGKGTWRWDNSRCFKICSLVFVARAEPIAFESSCFLEIASIEMKRSEVTKPYCPIHDSFTLTSSSTITPFCVIGSGEFGEVLLVHVAGIPFPCVLKRMLRIADETVVKECQKEFKVQQRLFNNPKCFNRIPRPLYILDLLDADFTGVYGFLMEFCVGGSVSAFAKSWCADGGEERKYVSADEDDSDSDSDSSPSSTPFNPMTLNPVKVCSLCVGMIECLDDVFTAKPKLIHRDIKPDNFLVRVDPKDGECTVVLGDLGLVQIQQSISSSKSSKSFSSHSTFSDLTPSFLTISDASTSSSFSESCSHTLAGTIVYSSFESLAYGDQSQLSDAHSLGMSILALFLCKHPFIDHPALWMDPRDSTESVRNMIGILRENRLNDIFSRSILFKSLLTIDGGKYKHVHECLCEVFTGLTQIDISKRMSVHQAREKIQSIKPLLPKVGEGFVCPSIERIIRSYRAK